MSASLNNVLNMLDRKILEAIRLIENEEYLNAKRIIMEAKRNLMRIRSALSEAAFESIKHCLDNLEIICARNSDENLSQEISRYRAPIARSGGRGRPQVVIEEVQLRMLINENYTAKQMAQHFGCSSQLIYKKCYSLGIRIREKYFRGSDDQLRLQITDLHNQFPYSGSKMMTAYLKSSGKTVQRHKVRKILTEIDPVGTTSRWSNSIQRRTYSVPTPNALWHIDAHLKLIRWKFAIHGCIDGYSRLILYLDCSTAMTARCVINSFAKAATEYGLPSRVRSDFGYENLFVAMLMNLVRGINRNSHITGRSVHNQRIERLWVDVIKEVVTFFYNEFTYLEDNGLLDVNNQTDMFALQKVYTPFINKKLDCFKNAWNSHQIRTEGHKTPRQLWLSGMLNNCNSQYTAPNEVFQEEQPDLYTRMLNAVEIDSTSIPIVSEDQEGESNLTVRVTLNTSQINYISTVVEDAELDYLTKYVRIKNHLREVH